MSRDTEPPELAERLGALARAWDVSVDQTLETAGAVLAFGRRGDDRVVLKVVRSDEETSCGRVLQEFDGRGTVRVLAHVPGAALLEQLMPGTALVEWCRSGEDEAATEVLADVVAAMGAAQPRLEGFPNVAEWGESLDTGPSKGHARIPAELVEEAAERYTALCASQAHVRLLHGDLHHYNVLLDSARGWVAIDPKGVIGELEYELGASLRNPYESLDQFAAPKIIERRVRQFEARLGVDAVRVLEWAFAQAVLAAVWAAEDGPEPSARSPFLMVAESVRRLLR